MVKRYFQYFLYIKDIAIQLAYIAQKDMHECNESCMYATSIAISFILKILKIPDNL